MGAEKTLKITITSNDMKKKCEKNQMVAI